MDKDIQEMFRKKNREMLIHNLELDIERNIEILMESLINLFNLQFDIATKNIFSMYREEFFLEEIKKTLESLKNRTFLLLSKALEIKKNALLGKLEKLEFEEEQMNEYYHLVFSTTNEVLQLFKSNDWNILKKDAIEYFYEKGNEFLKDDDLDVINYRIRDYIMDRLFGKLEYKVKQEIFIRDNNLSNKGKESYEKFQELEQKTTKI